MRTALVVLAIMCISVSVQAQTRRTPVGERSFFVPSIGFLQAIHSRSGMTELQFINLNFSFLKWKRLRLCTAGFGSSSLGPHMSGTSDPDDMVMSSFVFAFYPASVIAYTNRERTWELLVMPGISVNFTHEAAEDRYGFIGGVAIAF